MNFCRLCAGIALNELWNIDFIHAAATDFNGVINLNVGVHDWSGFGASLESFPINGETHTQAVRAITVDSLALENVGCVKIDVEGHELDVLRGAKETLRRSGFPPLLIEIWNADDPEFAWYRDKRQATLSFLSTIGYDMVPISGWPHMMLGAHP